MAMSFFCYHFPFGETQKAWHRNPTKDLQSTKDKRSKAYKRLQKKKFTKEEILQKKKKHKRETFLNLQKTKRKQIFTKDKKQHKFFLHKRESEADYKRGTEKRNAKWKDRRTRRESP